MTVRHYSFFGGFLGGIAFFTQLLRFILDGGFDTAFIEGQPWWDYPLAFLALIGILLCFCLLGAGIGWLIGWSKTDTKKRRRSSDESLVVRRKSL